MILNIFLIFKRASTLIVTKKVQKRNIFLSYRQLFQDLEETF